MHMFLVPYFCIKYLSLPSWFLVNDLRDDFVSQAFHCLCLSHILCSGCHFK